jgi:hypothetical protein
MCVCTLGHRQSSDVATRCARTGLGSMVRMTLVTYRFDEARFEALLKQRAAPSVPGVERLDTDLAGRATGRVPFGATAFDGPSH